MIQARVKKNYVSESFELRNLQREIKLQYSERLKNVEKNYIL